MSEADKLGNLLRSAYAQGAENADAWVRSGLRVGTFEDWLAEHGDEVLAAVAELAAQVRAQQAAKVRALAGPAYWPWQSRHMTVTGVLPRSRLINALARDIEDGTL